MKTIYSISKDNKYITAFQADAQGNPVGIATIYTKASLTAKIAQLASQSASSQVQVKDLTDNALALFTN